MKKKINKDKIKTNRLLIIAIIILILSISVFLISVFTERNGLKILESKEFYASVNVSENEGGFDLNSTALTFGKIKIGGSSSRNIIFKNNRDFAVDTKISVNGSISRLLSFNKVETIDAGETKKIGFSVLASNDIKPGFYDGIIRFDIYPSM